jgi:YgiT-type zinc finger domain-containing protein
MERKEVTYPYEESGLKNVLLVGVPMYQCPSCKASEVEIPCMEELHILLAFLIVLQPQPLKASEVRYLRKHVGYSQEDLARLLGVTRITVTRWESNKGIQKDQDKHLRRLYLQKKADEFRRLPEIHRILSTLVDWLPLEKKTQRRIRVEDWACLSTTVSTRAMEALTLPRL